MRYILAALGLAALLGGGHALAQTELDHNVQRTWDNVFNPQRPGDPRTNWERRRDDTIARDRREAAERSGYDRRREDEHVQWCRVHPGAQACSRY